MFSLLLDSHPKDVFSPRLRPRRGSSPSCCFMWDLFVNESYSLSSFSFFLSPLLLFWLFCCMNFWKRTSVPSHLTQMHGRMVVSCFAVLSRIWWAALRNPINVNQSGLRCQRKSPSLLPLSSCLLDGDPSNQSRPCNWNCWWTFLSSLLRTHAVCDCTLGQFLRLLGLLINK